MPSSGHHTLLAFEIVTPPIVAPPLTRAVPTCTPPAACRRRTLGTPAAPACRSGLDDVTPDRVPSTPTPSLRRAPAARARANVRWGGPGDPRRVSTCSASRANPQRERFPPLLERRLIHPGLERRHLNATQAGPPCASMLAMTDAPK